MKDTSSSLNHHCSSMLSFSCVLLNAWFLPVLMTSNALRKWSIMVYALGSSLKINIFILYFPRLEEPMVDGTRGSLEEALTLGALNASGSFWLKEYKVFPNLEWA